MNPLLARDPSFLDEAGQQAVVLRNRGLGITSIAKAVGIPKSQVRRKLILAGEYSVPEKHSGIKRKGKGKFSRISKAIVRENKQKAVQAIRGGAAKALRRMKGGQRLETACRDLGLQYSTIRKYLSGRTSYKYVVSKWAKSAPGTWPAIYRAAMIRSALFTTETEMQNSVEATFQRDGVKYDREKNMGGSRCDFVVGCWHIELKVQTNSKAIYTVIGQLLTHRASDPNAKMCAIVPSDCSITPRLWGALQSASIRVETELTVHRLYHAVEAHNGLCV